VGGAASKWDRDSASALTRPRHARRRSASGRDVPALLTLGYQQRTINEFIGLLVEAEVDLLVDVRETPWSHKPGFSKSALQTRLAAAEIEYVHARFAGNPRHIRANASSHAECLALYSVYLKQNRNIMRELDTLVGNHLKSGKRVCLTCYERHPDDCHRGILSAQWRAQRSRRITHLATDGCPRLVSHSV